MSRRPTLASTQQAMVIAALAGAAAAAAPLTLTGAPLVDAIERAVLASTIVFIAAHGHRWAWMVAGALVVIPARDASLVIAMAGLAVAVISAARPRRSKILGAISTGLLVNAAMWYPAGTPQPLGWVAGTAAMTLVVASGWPEVRRAQRRRILIGSAVTVALMSVATVAAIWVTTTSRADVEAGSRSARSALRSVRGGDAETARARLGDATDHFGAASSRLDGIPRHLAAGVPILAQQFEAIDVAVAQGLAISTAANDLVAGTDYDALRYEGKVDLQAVERLRGPAERVSGVLDHAADELDAVDDAWLVPPLRTRVADLSADISATAESADLARELLDTTPGLLGADGDRTYLVAFLTAAELRGAGGFIGSYAELRASDGRLEMTRSGRIEDLIDAAPPGTRTLSGPEEYLRRYGRDHLTDFLQDLTVSPDFPSVATAFAELYPQSGGRPVDGVIGVDLAGMAALLELTGPVTDPLLPEPLTADNVEELLLERQYVEYGDRAARGDIQAAATRATFDKLTDASLPSPRELGDALGPAVAARHLQLWSTHDDEQRLFERLGATGALHLDSGADGFSVWQQNAGNNKIDAYLQRRIGYDAVVDPKTGEVTATLTIDVHNGVPSTDLPDPVVANSRARPRGSSVATFSIATPHQLVSATIDGAKATLGPDAEAGLNVYDTSLVTIPPGGNVRIVVELRGQVDLTDAYHLQVRPQPVAHPDVVETTIRVEGGRFSGPDARRGRLVHRGPLAVPLAMEAVIKG